MKNFLTPFVTWLLFTTVTSGGIHLLAGEAGSLLTLANGVLPILCYVAALALVEIGVLVSLVLYLLRLPFRLLGLLKKRDQIAEEREEAVSRSYGISAIFVSTIIYAIAGIFLINYREVDFPLWAFCTIGLIWGGILYYGFQRGVIDELESEL